MTATTDRQSDKQEQSFWTTHFGTDLLCAAWFFLVSSLLYYIVMAYGVSSLDFLTTRNAVVCNYICLLVSSIIYSITAILVITVSYPTVYRKILADASVADIEAMSFMELYFTGNIFLVASWLLLLGTLPLVIYPVWGLVIGSAGIVAGILYLLFVVVANVILFLCVVACMPENLIRHTQVPGSTFIYDFFAKFVCCCFRGGRYIICCGCEVICAASLARDYQIVLWVTYVLSLIGLSGQIFYLYYHPQSFAGWFLLFSWITFAAGSYLYAIETYSEHGDSSVCFDCLTCSSSGKSKRRNDRSDDNERSPLVSDDVYRNL